MRARMTLRYAGIRCELREVVLRNKPSEMLAASPKGTVPVLVVSNGERTSEVIDESLDVMLWALAQHDPDGWLDVNMMQANELIAANDDDFKIWLDRYKYPNREAGSDADEVGAQRECERFLTVLEDRLSRHAFLMGDRLSFVDAAIFPFVRQFAFVDRDWFANAAYKRLRHWLSYLLETELFAQAMLKYPAWQGGEEKVIF
jgi:glutathione S-transferase